MLANNNILGTLYLATWVYCAESAFVNNAGQQPRSLFQQKNTHIRTWLSGDNDVSTKGKTQLNGGFFDDIMSGKMFGQDGDEYSKNEKKSETEKKIEKQVDNFDDEINWNEADFRNEINKRNNDKSMTTSENVSPTAVAIEEVGDKDSNQEEEEKEFDGYAMRDAIYRKWGACYDIDFQPVTTFGFRELYLNVMPFKLGGRRFRHETELDYLCHLQAVVEILDKYDQLDYVLAQLEETTKKPRAGTSPLVAVPFRLDLTEDELNSILQ